MREAMFTPGPYRVGELAEGEYRELVDIAEAALRAARGEK